MFLQFEFNRILNCVTKRECVTSRVRKDTRGYCITKAGTKIVITLKKQTCC